MKIATLSLAIAALAGGIVSQTPKAHAYAPIYHDPDYRIEYIIQRESSGRPWAVNYLGCAGLMQRCPGSLLAAECPAWADDVPCQLRHFTNYAYQRYGGWNGAYWHSVTYGWW
jgi:hypothetical protein